MVPVECVARGYLTGSGLLDYGQTGKVCGITLPPGLVEASRFSSPLFTPATKAELGQHDENISFPQVIQMVGGVRANQLRDRTVQTYVQAADHALRRGSLSPTPIRVRYRRAGLGAGRRDFHSRLVALRPAADHHAGVVQASFDSSSSAIG